MRSTAQRSADNMAEPRTTRRRKADALEKCPGCHSYFVEHGHICPNCEKKQEAEVSEDADNLETE